MRSMVHLESEVYRLSAKIGYSCLNKINLSKDDERFVWNLIDFGYGHETNIMEGRCSLQETINFDICKWEQKMVSDLQRLKSIKREVL